MNPRPFLKSLLPFASALLVTVPGLAWAVPPDVPRARLHQTSWTSKEGAPNGGYAIAETRDGWMWFGTADGLYRFDGVTFERVETDHASPRHSWSVRALLALESGELVIGYQNGGVGILRDGNIVNYREAEGLDSATVFDFVLDADKQLWAATRTGLLRFDGVRWHRPGPGSGLPEGAIVSLAVDNDGRLWASTPSRLYSLDHGTALFTAGPFTSEAATLVQARDGQIRYATDSQFVLCPFQHPAAAGVKVTRKAVSDLILFDQDGGVWASTEMALVRVASAEPLVAMRRWNGVSLMALRKALGDEAIQKTDDTVVTMLQGHDGGLWMTLNDGGVAKLRDVPAVRMPGDAGLLGTGSLASLPDGTVWLSVQTSLSGVSSGDGLWRLDGQERRVQQAGIPSASLVHASPDGTLRVAAAGQLWRGAGQQFVREGDVPTANMVNAVVGMADDARTHALWVAVYGRGLFTRHGTRWERNGGLATLPDAEPAALANDVRGSVWLGYRDGRVVEIDRGAVARDLSAAAAQVGSVRVISAGRVMLVAGDRGLALLREGRFIALTVDTAMPIDGTTGMVETPDGDVWLNAREGLVFIPRSELESALRTGAPGVAVRIFGPADGYAGVAPSRTVFGNTLARAPDGRLWFAADSAIGVLDPKLVRPDAPVPLVLRSMTTSSGRIDARAPAHFAAGTRELQVDYTALDDDHPERERFRYRLVGLETRWTDAGSRRQAFFTNLGPGHYRFEVESRTEAIGWQTSPVTQEIDIPPTFLQSRYFVALCALAGVLGLALLVRTREQQLRRRERLSADERLAERERIARELHDTLLQSTQGLALQVHAAATRIPPGELTRTMLDKALADADLLMIEGRDRIQSLRLHEPEPQDIETRLRRLGQKLADKHAIDFRISVHGAAAVLEPEVADEAHRIGAEALLNAFRHARARRVEVELQFAADDFRLRIRDDGAGIDAEVLRNGHAPGRWGLRGMRERALRVGGALEVWSGPGAGAEIEFRIAAALAYVGADAAPRSRWRRLARWFTG